MFEGPAVAVPSTPLPGSTMASIVRAALPQVRSSQDRSASRVLLLSALTIVMILYASACASRSVMPGEDAFDGRPLAELVADSLSPRQIALAGTAAPLGQEAGITAQQASVLAQAWARQYGAFFRGTIEREHGRSVDPRFLRPCGTPLYARSSFAPLPDADDAARRYLGSWWLVALCTVEGEMAASLAVSALASHLELVNGRIVARGPRGNEFWVEGVPGSWGGPIPLSAEQALRLASTVTGRRALAAPELLAPSPSAAVPQGAKWRIQLELLPGESAAPVRGRTLATVYVGSRRFFLNDGKDEPLRVLAASQEQPKAMDVGSKAPGTRVQRAIRAGPAEPVVFEAIE